MINLGLLRNNYEFKKIDWEFILRFLSKYDLNVYFKKDYESKKNRKGTLGWIYQKKNHLDWILLGCQTPQRLGD